MCGIFAFLNCSNSGEVEQNELTNVAMKSKHRGPDNSVVAAIGKHTFIFHRLSIMDPSMRGNQPMMHPSDSNIVLMCNGEIYNYKHLCEKYMYKMVSGSDCEVILHLYKQFGIEDTIKQLDGAFAFILYDGNTNQVYAGRDPFGIRSLYIGYTAENNVVISSELKSVAPLCVYTRHFTPGCWWTMEKPYRFSFYERLKFSYYMTMNASQHNEEEVQKRIVYLLTNAVQKRTMSDREIGCFLSGGLDSSLVAALLSKEFSDPKKLHTYAIGMEGGTDLKYARMVAEHLGTTHHEVIVTKKEMLEALPDVVRQIESYDTTTVRASTPMFLLSKWIKKNTNTTVVFSGEGSDELSGSYMYFHKCPSQKSFQSETVRLAQDLYYFDVLRCDKSVSVAGLEARVPFLDMDFVRYYMQIPLEYKVPRNGIEKYLLRKSFESSKLLPKEVLWRTKEAFSDGCSSNEDSWYKIIQTFVDEQISDEDYEYQRKCFVHNEPQLKETLYYRKLFEKNYPGCSHERILPYLWMPKWTETVNDPSARVLSVYKET